MHTSSELSEIFNIVFQGYTESEYAYNFRFFKNVVTFWYLQMNWCELANWIAESCELNWIDHTSKMRWIELNWPGWQMNWIEFELRIWWICPALTPGGVLSRGNCYGCSTSDNEAVRSGSLKKASITGAKFVENLLLINGQNLDHFQEKFLRFYPKWKQNFQKGTQNIIVMLKKALIVGTNFANPPIRAALPQIPEA